MQFKAGLLALMAAGSAMAHIAMKDPPPLSSKDNPNTQEQNVDYSLTNPLEGAGEFPCKNKLSLLGTPDGAPVKTYSPGEQASITLQGSAIHHGGSCQISLSYDKGKSFKVVKSLIGNCPTPGGGTFEFTIPEDAPTAKDVILAWTWVNKTGNREFYMSCAVVNIQSGGGSKRSVDKRGVSWSQRPEMFTANIGGKYCTQEGVDTVYPDPGPDVENNAADPGPPILCGGGGDAAGSKKSAGGAVFLPSSGDSGAAPTTTFATVKANAAPTTASAQQPAATGGASSSGLQTGACPLEGSWNCVDGTSFQRCASGQWTAAQPLASGTTCQPGVSDIITMSRRHARRHW
ncbi:hypothetical protein F5Y17DRAFT_182561 [Xylariaceae sp. FL0594]|nr:hypothetical protein F5Y17DRAFT_182561 [Xylariaceae sp. FL0594]